MAINKTWHSKNVLGQKASLERRIAWHIAHQKNCGCRPVPESIRQEIKKRKSLNGEMKICSRGHSYSGSGPCPVCWPGHQKRKRV